MSEKLQLLQVKSQGQPRYLAVQTIRSVTFEVDQRTLDLTIFVETDKEECAGMLTVPRGRRTGDPSYDVEHMLDMLGLECS